MKKLLVLILALLLIPSFVLADGMPFPRRYSKTFDFTAVKEKQQYAVIEVLSNYFEKMNLFLSLTSLDFEDHNVTVVIPLKAVPQGVSGDKLKSSEFLTKYNFDDVEMIIDRQSFNTFVKKSTPQIRDALGEYVMLSLISPLYEMTKYAVSSYYGGFMPAMAATGISQEDARNYPGVTQIASYEFEGATVDIYDVESGETLEDFMRDFYDLYIPSNVKEAVDEYKTHYIAVLNAVIGPPTDVSLLKQYAPETFKDALKHVRSNPEFTFTCYDYGYGYGKTQVYPYYPYTTCSAEEAVRQKFSDFINRAKTEAAGKITTYTTYDTQTLLYRDNDFVRLSYTYDWRYFSNVLSTAYTKLDIGSSQYVSEINIRYKNCLCSCCCGYCNSPGGLNVFRSDNGYDWFYVSSIYPYSNDQWKEETIFVNSYARYIAFSRDGSGPDRPDIDIDYVDVGTSYNLIETYPIGTSEYTQLPIEKAMIDFFLNAYSNATKGMEISMTLPIRNGEIFYPLGTGVAWSTPIEDTKILVKMDKSLDANFENVQNSVIDSSKRYYLWNYKNWNPDFDINGKVAPAGFLTFFGDAGKMITESLNENSGAVSILIAIAVIAFAALIVRYKGRGEKKRKTLFLILTILISPLISVWAVIFLAFGLKTKTEKGELKENMMNVLMFLGILIVAWIFMAITSIIIGG